MGYMQTRDADVPALNDRGAGLHSGCLRIGDSCFSLARGLLFIVLVPALAVTACACITIPGRDGVDYHLIVGLGVVRTKASDDGSVVATDARSLGVVVSDRPGLKLGVGYSSSTVVSVPDGAEDVRVEVSRRPWGPFVLEVPNPEQQVPLSDEDPERGGIHGE